MELIERGAYLAALGEHLGSAVAGHGRLVLVGSGGSGIGGSGGSGKGGCGKLNPFGGAVAQLGARLDGIEEVVGSNPIGSTNLSRSSNQLKTKVLSQVTEL